MATNQETAKKKIRRRAIGDDGAEDPDDNEATEEERVDDQEARESDGALEAEPPAPPTAPIANEDTTNAPDTFTLVRLETEYTNGSAEFRNLDFR